MFNHGELFAAIADAAPDRPCLVSSRKRLSYREVDERATRFANLLLSHDVTIRRARSELENWESGQDHVGLYLHNGHEYLEATFGADLARAAPFNVNYRYVTDELAYLLNDASTAALVFHACFAPTLREVLPLLRRQPLLVQVADGSGNALLDGALDYELALASSSPKRPSIEPDPDDLSILYTGGTTGMPKGTLWTQGALFEATVGRGSVGIRTDASTPASVAAALVAAPPPVFMPLPPLMHGASLWMALVGLLSGATVAFPDVVERLDPASVWRAVQEEGVAVLSVVGDAFARPLCDELAHSEYDVSSVGAFMSGGAVLSPKLKERLAALLPNTAVVDGAGASETGAHLSGVGPSGEMLPPGVFLATPDTCVLDETLTTVLAPGHDGIGWLARGGDIPLGYLGDAAKTERTFPVVDGRRLAVPGDRARQLPDGLVELLGRDAVTINSGGEKIFAEEVEQALVAHRSVEDVIVVGRASERWGQEVVAIVQLTPGEDTDDAELLGVASDHIARYKLPKAIIRVSTVRRTPTGKADYAWAREIAATPSAAQP